MGAILFWLKKVDENIDTPDWELFKSILVVLLVVSIVAGVMWSIKRYSDALKAFVIHSADDVFRSFTPGHALLWSLTSFLFMTGASVVLCGLKFNRWGSFLVDAMFLGLIAAILALFIAYMVVKSSASLTPRKYRYRNLIKG